MEEEFSGAGGIVVLEGRELIFLDIKTHEPGPVFFEENPGSGKVGTTVSYAFDFGSGQLNTGLVVFDDLIIENGFFVLSKHSSIILS